MRLLTSTLCLLVLMFPSLSAAISTGTPDHAIIHYVRDTGDYGDHTTGDFNDFWGLHLWGDGIDAGEATGWTSPKPFLGEDEYGRFAWIKLIPGATEVNFVVHRGDVKDGTTADRTFNPSATPEIWIRQDDPVAYGSRVEAQGFVTIHYHRDDGDYGDPTSPDFNDYWGLHLWTGAALPTSWTDPLRPDSLDVFGARFRVDLVPGATALAYILHRGDIRDPGPDQALHIGVYGHEVWQLEAADPESPYILPIVQAQEVVENFLVEAIEALTDDGTLNQGRGNALLSRLNDAIKKIDQGKDAIAVSLLQAFSDQVNDLVDDGILTPADGQPLIDGANAIINALGG